MKVSPRICSGRTYELATSQTTRAAIVSVLPDPAPATTSSGSTGAAMIAACSRVGAGNRSSLASSTGVYRGPESASRGVGAGPAPNSVG
ncbi:hypothetical protein PSN13_02042 [Micromonospora saelicesensis]|uniref:Uncharacterized protein n=1 Tax=Micromonospora saelicesensis TaxID=285676 RepID=A0A328NTW5_9ACTN|nr:hypothetical protein PSN13_02042 [Micromonospora saelicesensis]